MRRLFAFLISIPLFAACTVSEYSPRSAPPASNPPQQSVPWPTSGNPPAGVYSVTERVLNDTCHPVPLPPQVSVIVEHRDGVAHALVPLPDFTDATDTGRPFKREDLDLRGFKAAGASRPKWCPGPVRRYSEDLTEVTPTSMTIAAEYEIKDPSDCPNPRPRALCHTSVVYEFHLVAPACDGRCDGTLPGTQDKDVPPGPVGLSCSCRSS